MLGLGNTVGKALPSFLSYVKEGLKLYMPCTATEATKGVSFVGGDSMEFDGTNDYVLCGDDTSLDITDDLTMMAWVKPASAGSNAHIIGRDDGVNRNYVLYVNGNTYIFDYFVSGTAQRVTSTTADTANIWVHLACTRHKATGKNIIYVNGVAEDSDTDSTAAIDNDDVQFSIGARDDATSDFRGRIKNVAIWSRALTATEVQNVMWKQYRFVSNRLLTRLVSWWALEESVVALVTKAADSHGSNTGTITGATVSAAGDASEFGGTTPLIPRSIDNAPTVQADAIGSGSALFVASNADYINVGNSSSLQITGNAVTVTAWVNILTDTDWMKIISNSTGGSYTDGYTFFYSNEQFHFSINHETANVAKVAYTTYGEWHHLTGVYNGANIYIYVDGVLGTTTDTYTANIGNTRDTYIGAGYTDAINGHMNGNISQVGIWQGALTQEKIQSVMEKTFEELTATEKSSLGAELLTDGDMEASGTTGWDDHVATHDAALSKETSIVNSGSKSLKALRADSGAGGMAQAVSGLSTSTLYRLTGYIYSSSGNVYIGYKNDSQLGSSLNILETITTTEEWLNFTSYFVAPATTTYVGIWKNNDDTYALLDDWSLKAVTHDLVSYWSLDDAVGDINTHVADLVDTSLGSELVIGNPFVESEWNTYGTNIKDVVSGESVTFTATDGSNYSFGGSTFLKDYDGNVGILENDLDNGSTYKLSCSFETDDSDAVVRVFDGSSYINSSANSGEKEIYFTVSDKTNTFIRFLNLDTGNYVKITSISVKLVNGNYGKLI